MEIFVCVLRRQGAILMKPMDMDASLWYYLDKKLCISERGVLIMKKLSVLLSIILICLSANVISVSADESRFVRVEAGEVHVVALKSDGTVWAWGSNLGGVLGDGTERSRYTPVQVKGVDNVIDIAIKGGFTFALKSDGTTWGWGYNYSNYIGFEHTSIQIGLHPVQIDARDDCSKYFRGKKVDGTGAYKILSAVEDMSLGIKADGSVWQDGVELKQFFGAQDVAVGVGNYQEGMNGYIVTADGVIVSTGPNLYGQLGNGFTSTIYAPQKIEGVANVKDVSALHDIYIVHRDGTVSIMYSRNKLARFKKIPMDNVVQITQSVDIVAALKGDGTVWTWPLQYDQPGEVVPTPIQAAELSDIVNISATQDTIFAVDKNGQGFAKTDWIRDDAIMDVDGDYAKTFCPIKNATNAAGGYVDYDDFILLTKDKKLFCASHHYSVGQFQRPKLQEIITNGAVKEVASFLTQFWEFYVLREDGILCAVSESDNIYTCTVVPNIPAMTDISANFDALLALDGNGRVWQWGADGGNRGIDDNNEYDAPYRIPGLYNIGTVAAGGNYYFAITKTGELYAWGKNGNGQLISSENYTNRNTWAPVKSSCINMMLGSADILVNNYAMQIPAAPVVVNSRTLGPVREIVENLGGTVLWEDGGKVTVEWGRDILILNIGSLEAQFNGKTERLEVAPEIINGKTFLPVRYVCEKLGADVLWEESIQRITITK